jgi:hypothetical protein
MRCAEVVANVRGDEHPERTRSGQCLAVSWRWHAHIFQGWYELHCIRRAPWRPPAPSADTAAPLHPASPANTLKTLRISPFAAPRRPVGRFFPTVAFLARRLHLAGCGVRVVTSFALTLRPSPGVGAYRRPPVWRAVVRPARYFFMGCKRLRRLQRARLERLRPRRRFFDGPKLPAAISAAWFLAAKHLPVDW